MRVVAITIDLLTLRPLAPETHHSSAHIGKYWRLPRIAQYALVTSRLGESAHHFSQRSLIIHRKTNYAT